MKEMYRKEFLKYIDKIIFSLKLIAIQNICIKQRL